MSDEQQTTAHEATRDSDLATALARIDAILAENPHAEDEDKIRHDDGLLFGDLRELIASHDTRNEVVVDPIAPPMFPIRYRCSQALLDAIWPDMPYRREDGWRIDTIIGPGGPFATEREAERWAEGQKEYRARLVSVAIAISPVLWARADERIPSGWEKLDLHGGLASAASVLSTIDRSYTFDGWTIPDADG
jgi:hypothetical protein